MNDVTSTNASHASLLQQIRAVKKPIESSATLPPAVYSDPGIFEQEKQRLFRTAWVGVGRTDRWRSAGDYSALDIMGVPLVILCDNAGSLRAFANSCRHRGAKLLGGTGACKVIRCPFHRWTYSLDGRLLAAPHMENTPGFDAAKHGLVPVRVESRAGFTFVCLDPEAESLERWLGDIADIHAPWPLTDLISTRRREFEVGCNWKLFLEVFNEYYHLPYVHPESIGAIYNTPQSLDAVNGNYVTQFGTTAGTGALLKHNQEKTLPVIDSLTGDAATGTRYTWMFPNMTFAAGQESIWVYDVYPISPCRTWVGMTVCFPASTVELSDFEEHAQFYYRRMDAALNEDIPALENQHAGLQSPLAKQGRFSCLEPGVATFACWYADRMFR